MSSAWEVCCWHRAFLCLARTMCISICIYIIVIMLIITIIMCIYIYIYSFVYMMMMTTWCTLCRALSYGSKLPLRCVSHTLHREENELKSLLQLSLSLNIAMANLRTTILEFRGFDSSRTFILRGGIRVPSGSFSECLSQAILVGMILVGRLAVQ